MDYSLPVYYDEINMKIQMGSFLLNILYIRYEPPFPHWNVDNHCHSCYELHFIPSGNGCLRIAQQSYNLEAGIFYLTGPGIYHEQITNKLCPMSEFSISFEIVPIKGQQHFGTGMDEEVKEICDILISTSFFIGNDTYNNIDLFNKVFTELQEKKLGYYIHAKSMITQIIINAARCYAGHKVSTSGMPSKRSDDSRRFVIDFQFAEYYKTLTLKRLAKYSGVSIRQLNRIILKYYGMTFTQKLMDTRMRIARDQLLNTELPILQISDGVGFKNVSYFYRAFKKKYGTTPNLLRKQGISQ